MTGDADDAVALFILQNVRLLIHVGDRVMHGIDPEREPHADERFAAERRIQLVVQIGMTVVILVQSQNDVAASRKLDGICVLHLRRVQIPVRDDDRRTRILCRRPLRHVQKTAQLAVCRFKADTGNLGRPCARVEHARQNAAQENQAQSDRKRDQCSLFHIFTPPV